jgi:hypothetical protein
MVVSDDQLEGLPAQAQTLILSDDTEVFIYHRVSNGMKGRGQAWKQVALAQLPSTPISHEVCAVVISDRDRDMMKLGQITNIGIKALYALETAEAVNDEVISNHNEVAGSLIARLEIGDNSLNDYITDKRRNQGVSIKPIVKGADTPIAEAKIVEVYRS